MRVLQINSSRTYAGGEKHFVDLCRGISESGCDVYISVRTGCDWISRLDLFPAERIIQIPLRNAADLISAGRLAKLIRKNKIEIVHAHLARDYPLAAMAVRQAPGARLVLTRHVMFPLKNVHKLLLKNVSKAIGVSDAVAGNLRKIFPVEKVVRVYNGLDPAIPEDPVQAGREFRFKNNISYDDTVITSVGTFTPLKGQMDLITAAPEILSEHPGASFVFVGRDETREERFLARFRSHAERMGVAGRTLFLDWFDEPGSLMAATDLFVSSSHSESFGLALLEAMAYGKPIVATSTAGAKELISDGETGLLVPTRDPSALSEAVLRLIGNRTLADELAKNASVRAKNRFNLKRMIADTTAVYREVLNN